MKKKVETPKKDSSPTEMNTAKEPEEGKVRIRPEIVHHLGNSLSAIREDQSEEIAKCTYSANQHVQSQL